MMCRYLLSLENDATFLHTVHMNKIPDAERQRVVALYTSGYTIAAVTAMSGYSLSAIFKWIRAAGANRPRGYPLNTSYFHTIDSPEKAYWLGMLAADGAIADGPKKYCVALTLAERDRPHIELYRKALGTELPIYTHISKKGNRYSRLSVTCVEMVKDLMRHGVGPRKSHTLKPWDGPLNLQRHYWRGVWDGDGSLAKSGEMSLVGSKSMMAGFAKYTSETLGFTGPVDPHKSIWSVRYWRKGEVAVLAKHLYERLDGAPALARKAARAVPFIAWTPKLNNWSWLTADKLLELKAEHGGWGKVATSLGIKSYCVLWKQRKRLAV